MVLSRLQSFVNLQASEFAVTQVVPTARQPIDCQGGRDVYVRAQRGLLPPRASDMLAVRNRAIDGKGLSPPRFAALPAAPGICTHWKGAAFSRRTPKADLRACACGHLPQIDQSKRFNADAQAFYPWLRRNVPLRGRDASWLGGEFHSIAEVSQSFNQAVFLPLFAT